MRISREDKKKEALNRLRQIGLFAPAIKDFEKYNRLNISEPPLGALYWITEEKDLKNIAEFEKEYNALVYHVVKSYTQFGVMNNYFYVSDYEDEWEMDNEDLKDGYAVVYADNLDDPSCSEIGSIQWELLPSGGIRRTA